MDPNDRDALSNELEAHGLDADGFHEDEDAVATADLDGSGSGGDVGSPGQYRTGKAEHPTQEPASGVHKVGTVRGRGARVRPEAGPNALYQPDASWFARGTDGGRVLGLSVYEVGCFYVRRESHEKWTDRWRAFNKLTGFEHVTYGSQEDVDKQLLKQTKGWENKIAGIKPKVSAFNYVAPKRTAG